MNQSRIDLDDDDEEFVGLVSPNVADASQSCILLFLSLFVVAATGTMILLVQEDRTAIPIQESLLVRANETLPIFACPADITASKNDKDIQFYGDKRYTKKNWTDEELKKLKMTNIDGWDKSYNIMKQVRKDWILKTFSELRPGDGIFESACGKGTNLLMKVELLKEKRGTDGFNVYGIDYRQAPVDEANDMFSQVLPRLGSSLGAPVCRGDATNLFFIPSESFDISYTGYIDPIIDPLGIESEPGSNLDPSGLCHEKNRTLNKLSKLDQEAQETWYAAWATELIRVTKKGKLVVVEEVSLPLCESPNDWGGVSKMWWKEAATIYNWDVDIDSISTINAGTAGKEYDRYNVVMRRRTH